MFFSTEVYYKRELAIKTCSLIRKFACHKYNNTFSYLSPKAIAYHAIYTGDVSPHLLVRPKAVKTKIHVSIKNCMHSASPKTVNK